MRTSAMRYPGPSKRLAWPGSRSSTRQSTTDSGIGHRARDAPLAEGHTEAFVHLSSQQRSRRADGPSIDDGVEETLHDQTLGHVRGDAARLDVVPLVLADRSARQGMETFH